MAFFPIQKVKPGDLPKSNGVSINPRICKSEITDIEEDVALRDMYTPQASTSAKGMHPL